MSRLRRLNCLCSSKESGSAYRFRHGSTLCSPTVEKILCRSPFRSGRRSLVCVRLSNKGKVGVQRGRETAGVPSFLSPPRTPRRSRHPQAAYPSLRFSENSPPRQGEHAYAVRAPRLSGAGKSCRPLGRTVCAVRAPRSIGAEKRAPPKMGEPPARFVHPVKRALCKSKFPKENPHAIG